MIDQNSTAENHIEIESTTTFQPSAVQLARADALQQYNWLSIYLPLIIVTLFVVGAAGWMLWATVISPDEAGENAMQVSALADIVIIFSLVPMILSCLILPIAAGALIYYDREREHTRIHALQRLLWRVDYYFNIAREKVEQTSPRVARPIIRANSMYSFVVRFLQRIKNIIF